ncbi:hypothetical protein ACFPOE_11335 [Caenimonas terrae]|uniref:Uncharacterized protein n=1 Tax=Caenimonas terrae TaxID=696074 RepID=A0ABW0NGS9_9BURK
MSKVTTYSYVKAPGVTCSRLQAISVFCGTSTLTADGTWALLQDWMAGLDSADTPEGDTFRQSVAAASQALVTLAEPPPPAPPPPSVVPQAIDMVKAEVYFIRIGIDQEVKDAVAAAGAEAQAIWQRSKTVQRNNALMLQIATNVLHWTAADIDAHFIAADKIEI